MKTIAVGTDGSKNAMTAMRWAMSEAALHDARLEAILVWSYIDQHHADGSDTFDSSYSEATAQAVLAAWVSDALGPGACVDQRVVLDLPARALLETSQSVDLLVLGARGKGGFEGLLLGSVSERVAQLGACPVAVVRTSTPMRGGRVVHRVDDSTRSIEALRWAATPAPVHGGRVVVGVDGSARSIDALRWAATEARARDAELDVVHAQRSAAFTKAIPFPGVSADAAEQDSGQAILDAALGDRALRDLHARAHLVRDSPPRALLARAGDAGLLVVGTHGRGRISGVLMGSVSRQLLHHAPCPVVVI